MATTIALVFQAENGTKKTGSCVVGAKKVAVKTVARGLGLTPADITTKDITNQNSKLSANLTFELLICVLCFLRKDGAVFGRQARNHSSRPNDAPEYRTTHQPCPG